MVTTKPRPETTDQAREVGATQEHHQSVKEGLAGVLARIDEIRSDAEQADAILSKADVAVGRAKWAARDCAKAHEASESAGRVMSECSAALDLVPEKLRVGLRDLWTAEIALTEAQAAEEEAEARELREAEMEPLTSAWGHEEAERVMEQKYRLPELHANVRLGDNGNYETVFPTGSVVTVTRPEWFVTLHVGIPKRRARILAIGKLLAALSDRTDADLEKTSRKLAEKPEA